MYLSGESLRREFETKLFSTMTSLTESFQSRPRFSLTIKSLAERRNFTPTVGIHNLHEIEFLIYVATEQLRTLTSHKKHRLKMNLFIV